MLTFFRHLFLTTACMILLSPSTWANDFGARQYPFIPSLIHNDRPPLCQAILTSAKTTFFSNEPHMYVKSIEGGQWIEWQEISEVKPTDTLGKLHRLDLDLGGSGKKQTLIWSERTSTSGRGDQDASGVYFFSSQMDFRVWLKGAQDSEEPFKGAQEISSGLGTEHRLFQFQEKYYFLDSEQVDHEAAVSELNADGTATLMCKVSMAPEGDFNFSTLPGLKSYLDRLSTMGVAGGGFCGSAHFEDDHNEGRKAAVWRAAVRPWATSSVGTRFTDSYYYYDQRLLQFLKDWSYADVWNFGEYQTYQHHIGPAKQALVRYYSDNFGLPTAVSQRRAETVFQELTAAHFLISRNYTVGDDTFTSSYYGYAQFRESDSLLRQGILLGDLAAVRENMPDDKEVLNNGRYLLNAVEHPVILQAILNAGADIHARNDFGKSALMVAAHMNRPDSVHLLLQAGADPNLETTVPQGGCGYSMSRTNRTALMYAAENADIDVMRILVDAGAKTDAKDSEGNGMGYYLALNPYLTTVQKRMSLVELLSSAKQDSAPTPSFDCTATKQRMEKLICKDPILARQDRNLATAFTSWKVKAESPDKEKTDQVAWLGHRAQHCGPIEDESRAISCLQIETRARIRYLHNRIAE